MTALSTKLLQASQLLLGPGTATMHAYNDSLESPFLPFHIKAEMLQYLLFLCAFAVPGFRALAVPVIEATAEDPKCLDITHCRTLSNIVWSSLVTIIACTWVSIHRNVVLDSGSAVTALLDRVGITVLTLLIPELTLAWAIRQWIVAIKIARRFRQLIYEHELRTRVDSGVGAALLMEPVPVMEPATKLAALATVLAELWKYDRSIFSDDGPWTITQGFFVLMGGFYYFEGDEPDRPVSPEELEHIIKKAPVIELPNKLEIDARSKSDAFSNIVTALQTLWFVVQCIARATQHLPITNIEITTLAYTTLSFAMSRFWFWKPFNVSRPIRLTRPERDGPAESEREEAESYRNVSSESLPRVGWRVDIKKFVNAVVGTQDDGVKLWELRQVPTFYAGKPEEHEVLIADAMAAAFGVIFGAVHCIAWSFAFPSQTERLLWRISAVMTVTIPPLYVMLIVLIGMEVKWVAIPALIISAVVMPLYLVARAVLLVLTFTTLRDLPPAAYEAIHWMSFLPHV